MPTGNLAMWSGAYPIKVFGVACNQIGVDLDSPAFKGLATAILIIAFIHWIWLVIFTLPMIASGELFFAEAEKLSKEESGREDRFAGGQRFPNSNLLKKRLLTPDNLPAYHRPMGTPQSGN
ncbi:hypothetical protein QFC22_001538 [Naganishia vaughanmartiniae]|uniref:Uncharacterized protein n=1 Tax=Naganishia vaughanmartiniae TaxID=1424756 RepID=A0ACC2XH39_9TREE|nr:hypothetical protein QFC22_001538 [Naganishia vaughanmartiniae]